MKILIAASEAIPYAKTGGLADVTGALSRVLKTMGHEVFLFLPLYRGVRRTFNVRDTGHAVTVTLGKSHIKSRVYSHGDASYFLEYNDFFDRDDLYGTPFGDYPDNAERYIFFARGVIEAVKTLGLKPDVIHCNDWQTGLIPLYLKSVTDLALPGTATLFTIHNLGYQGLFDAATFSLSGLNGKWFNPEGVEYYGKVNFMKAGIIASDAVTTVSNTYAREICTPHHGFGLDGVLRKYAFKLHGVINGIDQEVWDPSRDTFIPAHFSQTDIEGKEECRQALIRECSFSESLFQGPVVSFIGRLSSQKGVDILLQSAGDIVDSGIKLIILGQGDETYNRQVFALFERLREKVFARIGFDEGFARRIYAGSDMILMPSQYEPCGLSQLIAMRYGTIPIAFRTGGLADTIRNYQSGTQTGTGFLFDEYCSSALIDCMKSALRVYADRQRWRKLIKNAMRQDFSWKRSAGQYCDLYGEALKKIRGVRT